MGRIVDIINPSRIRCGLYALAVLTIVLLGSEVLCRLFGISLLEGACRHFITLQFIEQATTLSFSLTAFLLVGVVVISSFVVTEMRQLEIGVDEFELVLGEGSGNDDRSSITITYYENFESGEEKSEDAGLATWIITGHSTRFINAHPRLYEIIKLSEEPEGLRLGGNRYAVRDIEGEDTDPDVEEEYDHRVQGYINFGEDDLGNRYYRDPEEERARIHWLLREDESELRALERQLRRAVAYSVSASVLGVLIQGYPWIAEVASDPWLLDLSFPEPFVYTLASYLFTFIFLGMVGTSVSLLEVMAELLNR